MSLKASVTVLRSWTRHLTLAVRLWPCVPGHAVRTATRDQTICNGSKTIPNKGKIMVIALVNLYM